MKRDVNPPNFYGREDKGFFPFLFFLFLLALGQQLYKLYFVFREGNFVDFNVYWEAMESALRGEDFYQRLYLRTIPFNYPPTAFPLFIFLRLFPKSVASLLWLTISLSSLFFGIFLLIRLWFKKSQRITLFLLASIFFIQYFPTKFTLTLGQINLVNLFLITSSFYAFKKEKDLIAGIFLSVASLIKIFPAFLLLFFFKKKRKRVISSFIIASFFGILLAAFLFTPSSIFNYFGQIGKNLFLKSGEVSYFDQSLNSFFLRWKIADNLRLLLRLFISFFSISFFLKTKDEALSFFGFIAATIIFLPSFVWFHHYVILIPLMILLFSRIYKEPFAFPKIALLLGYLACSLHFRNPDAPVLKNIFLVSHPLIGAVILLFLAQYCIRFKR